MTMATFAILSLISGPSLSIGDKAPPLRFGEAVKGHPVRSLGDGRVTVVEFWATWCHPCIKVMPHLSLLASRYADKTDFLSISVMENDFSKVKPFVQKFDRKVTHPIAIDLVDKHGSGYMHRNWLVAARQQAIPVAFIVDQEARIAWIGDPLKLESVLDKVIAKKWDLETFRNTFEKKVGDEDSTTRLLDDAFGLLSGAIRRRNYYEVIHWIDQNRGTYLGTETQDALSELRRLFAFFEHGDFKSALVQTEREPTNGVVWTYFRPMYLIARLDALTRLYREGEAVKVVTGVLEGTPDPNILMGLVDALTLPESRIKRMDSDLALAAATKLVGYDRAPMFLLRLAWAQHVSGQTADALATIQEALSKMDAEKQRNPRSYESLLTRLSEAKAVFERG
jgi:thiol-disulfide isomerase/thioredoxin